LLGLIDSPHAPFAQQLDQGLRAEFCPGLVNGGRDCQISLGHLRHGWTRRCALLGSSGRQVLQSPIQRHSRRLKSLCRSIRLIVV
jgi:hypothetical protein